MLNSEILSQLLAQAANTDTASDALLKLKDEADSLIAEYANLSTQITEKDAKIAELRDTNHRLFLRQVGTIEPDKKEEEPETPEEAMNTLIEKIGGNK